MCFGLIRNAYTYGEPLGNLVNLTNGPFGIANIPSPAGAQLGQAGYAFASSVVLLLMLVLMRIWVYSPWGLLLQAIRDDELAARGLGKSLSRVKLQTFLFSAVTAALAGVIYAGQVTFIDPQIASVELSLLLLGMVIVGGLGRFYGALTGALILLGLQEFLHWWQIPETTASHWRMLIYGLLLLLIVHFHSVRGERERH
jgi:branched-chain amino acid transport system permease protein